jgi:hypothetical protein
LIPSPTASWQWCRSRTIDIFLLFRITNLVE